MSLLILGSIQLTSAQALSEKQEKRLLKVTKISQGQHDPKPVYFAWDGGASAVLWVLLYISTLNCFEKGSRTYSSKLQLYLPHLQEHWPHPKLKSACAD